MSFWRRHRWNRRFLLGFAFAVMVVPGQALAIESPSVLGEAVKTRQATVVPPDAVDRAVQAKLAAVLNYPSHVTTAADAEPVVPPDAVDRAVQAKLAAETPQVINYLSHGLTAADALDPRTGIPLSAGIPVAGDELVVGLETTALRPDDRPVRVPIVDTRPPVPATGGDGFDWENGLTVGFGALALAFGLGMALMYARRPRIAV